MIVAMRREVVRRVRGEIAELAESGHDWVAFAARAGAVIRGAVPFDRACWHPVDPGTVLFTGSFVENMACSAAWLAHHEYVVEDVNKWAFLARSGYRAGALSQATHGNLSLSPADDGFREIGVVVLDEQGEVESASPAAKRWIAELVEYPGASGGDSRVVQAVAARVHRAGGSLELPELPARARAFTRSGRWLLLHGTRLSGGGDGRTAVVIQPAPSHEIASPIVQAYGLSERERQGAEPFGPGIFK